MDKIDAPEIPPSIEDDAASAPLDLWGIVKTSLGDIFRIPRLGRRGAAALIGVVIVAWLSTALYRVQPDEKGVVLRFGKWVDDDRSWPACASALSDRHRAAAQGDADQPDPARRRRLGRGRGRPVQPRRADADRRREYRRGGLHRVLEGPRSGPVPVQGRQSRARRQDRRRGRAARRHQPHADPGGDVGQAPADRRRDPRAVAEAARRRARGRRDHPGATAARRAAARSHRRLQRRAARPRRSGARPQRGGGLRQRHSAARPRRRRAHPPGGRSLQGAGRQSRARRGRRIPAAPEELRGGQRRDRLAALSRQRRRGAEESLQGHRRHLRQGRVERRALYAGDRVQAARAVRAPAPAATAPAQGAAK